jgi:ribosomal protein S18 acetylase RimI-like enzyme
MMVIRQAAIGDAHHLAQFAISAHGGLNEALYGGLIPGRSVESFLEPEFARPGVTAYYKNHWIAELDGQVAGGINAFPYDDFANDTHDPEIREERYAVLQPFENLPAAGTYHVMTLSVSPVYRKSGVGSALLMLACEQARERGFSEISLYVFGQNSGALALYEKSQFKIAGRAPVVDHPSLRYTGELFLMVAAL